MAVGGFVLSHSKTPPGAQAALLAAAPASPVAARSSEPPAPSGRPAPEESPLPTAAPVAKGLRPVAFANPHDEAKVGNFDGPSVSQVHGHHVRMLTQLGSNVGNITDAVVRTAVDHSSWQYRRCYEQAFQSAETLEAGTAFVSFDIQNQLARFATLKSSSFASHEIGICLVRTLSAQTMNAADTGKTHVIYGFQFIVDD